jgi:hypothetical protein
VAGWRSDEPIDTVTGDLRSALAAAGVADVSIEVVAVEGLRRTNAGKAALVISEGP